MCDEESDWQANLNTWRQKRLSMINTPTKHYKTEPMELGSNFSSGPINEKQLMKSSTTENISDQSTGSNKESPDVMDHPRGDLVGYV